MSVFWVKRVGNSLEPDGVESAAEVAKLPFVRSLLTEVKRARSGPQHRLYWELCRRIGTAVGVDAENISDLLKIETGHCEQIHSKKYGLLRLPRSISFAAMEQTEFNEFFEKCVQTIYENWGIARKDVLAAVKDVLVPNE